MVFKPQCTLGHNSFTTVCKQMVWNKQNVWLCVTSYCIALRIASCTSILIKRTAIQAVKKGAVKSGSPTQDGQGEKVVKSRWRPRNGCDGRSIAKNFNHNNSGQFASSSQFIRNQHKI